MRNRSPKSWLALPVKSRLSTIASTEGSWMGTAKRQPGLTSRYFRRFITVGRSQSFTKASGEVSHPFALSDAIARCSIYATPSKQMVSRIATTSVISFSVEQMTTSVSRPAGCSPGSSDTYRCCKKVIETAPLPSQHLQIFAFAPVVPDFSWIKRRLSIYRGKTVACRTDVPKPFQTKKAAKRSNEGDRGGVLNIQLRGTAYNTPPAIIAWRAAGVAFPVRASTGGLTAGPRNDQPVSQMVISGGFDKQAAATPKWRDHLPTSARRVGNPDIQIESS